MATTTRPATEDDLRQSPHDGSKYELVDGAIVVSSGGARHGSVAVKLAARLLAHAAERRLGHVFDSSTGFRLPGGNVRVPDASFVATGRFQDDKPTDDFADLAPDLAVVDPRRRRAVAYRSLTEVREVGPADDLGGEDVLPGFRCSLLST
jgi:Uma2 family endonuclease